MAENKIEYVKRRTLELYDSLPQEEEERKKHIEVRDEVFELNQSFFGYIASHTFINNSAITYEDKYQSACTHFLECWWWYKYAARYRTDLSFTVFFRPRIAEMIERELNEVKYSIRRSLCIKAGDQLGKHWAKVRYEDLSDPSLHLSTNDMNSLKAIFGTLYWADLEKHEIYLESEEKISNFEYPSDNYNSIEDLLVHEMCELECKLTDEQLLKIADLHGLDFWNLKKILPSAEKKLYTKLRKSVDLIELQ